MTIFEITPKTFIPNAASPRDPTPSPSSTPATEKAISALSCIPKNQASSIELASRVQLATSPDGSWTPLHQACVDQDIPLATYHANNSKHYLNTRDEGGMTALHWACRAGNETLTKVLLEAGANPNKPDSDGHTPLDIASRSNSSELTILLVQSGARLEDSLLTRACSNEDCKLAQALVEAGVNVHTPDEFNLTPIQWALSKKNLPLATILIKAGATIESSLFFEACKQRNFELIALLVKKGMDINIKNGEGFSPIHVACGEGNYLLLQHLIASGADVNLNSSPTDLGEEAMSPIDLIAKSGDALSPNNRQRFIRSAQLLLWKGATLSSNSSPTIQAALRENRNLVRRTSRFQRFPSRSS